MWYNVENLFHPDDDTLAGDDEFSAGGVRGWSYSRYWKKLTAIAKVIAAAGVWEPPHVVGLCEVEDSKVLDALIGHPILAPYDFQYLHCNSPDHRGMDVAFLYRERSFHVLEWEVFSAVSPSFQSGTRDMMHICGVWGRQDTLDLFLVHLLSKYSGARATVNIRKTQVQQLVYLVDSVHKKREDGIQLLAGDFNDPFDGYSLAPLREKLSDGDSIRSIAMEGGPGSYKYRGHWSLIDQFLVCGDVTLYSCSGSIMQLPVLIHTDETYGGIKPFRTYEGYLYTGGISDHLPILLEISRRPFLIHDGL